MRRTPTDTVLTTQLFSEMARGVPSSSDHPLTAADLAAASRHGLLGMIYHLGGASQQRSATPVFARLLARQHVMDTCMVDIGRLLESAGIPCAVVKGTAVAAYYPKPSMRTTTDIDLVVPGDSAERATELLAGLPWQVQVPDRQPAAAKRDIHLARNGMTFTLDLHWDLFSFRQLESRASGAMEEGWRLAGDSRRMPEHLHIAFLCAHALLDHRYRLILFRDLALIAEREPDWEELIRFTADHGLRSTTYVGLHLAQKWGGAVIPDEVAQEIRPSSLVTSVLERLLEHVDPVVFDARTPNPVNLATILMHDDLKTRLRLAARAPLSAPGWFIRTAPTRMVEGGRSALVVVSSDARRGAQVFGEQIALGLRNRGWDTELVSLSATGSEIKVGARPLSDFAPDALPVLDAGLTLRLRRLATGFDVVLANGSSTLRYTAAALAALPRRPAFVFGSIGEPAYWARSRISQLRQSLLHRRPDAIAAVSRTTAEQLVEVAGVPQNRVHWAPTGVVSHPIDPRPSDERLSILTVGSLSAEKGPQLALEVAASIPASVLTMVGDGPLRGELEAAVYERQMTGRVAFVGSTADPAPFYRNAHVLLVTSRTEGLPGAVLEAASHGVPSIAFDVGGTFETIEAGVTGILVPPGRSDLMTKELSRLSHADLAVMGDAARSRVRAIYSLEAGLDRYETILRSAVRKRKRWI